MTRRWNNFLPGTDQVTQRLHELFCCRPQYGFPVGNALPPDTARRCRGGQRGFGLPTCVRGNIWLASISDRIAIAGRPGGCDSDDLAQPLTHMPEIQSGLEELHEIEAFALLLAEWVPLSLVLMADDQDFDRVTTVFQRAPDTCCSVQHPADLFQNGSTGTDRLSRSTTLS